jgi:EmrB/QacA subfamily drug resistance transporter
MTDAGPSRSDGGVGSDAPPALREGRVLAAVILIQLLIVIDFFALNLALPPMAKSLGTSVTDLQWVVSGYMIALGAFMVPAGRIADQRGRKKVAAVGVVIFGLASAACGSAPNAEVVILFRLVQGVGAAMCFPVSISVISATFPAARVQRSLGMVYGLTAMGQAIGPLVGGVLSDVNWRLVFLINVPFSAIALVLFLTSVPESRDETAPPGIDYLGVALVAGGLAATTFAVDKASDWGWGSPRTVGVLVLGIVLIIAFVLVEARERNPLLDLALLKNRAYVVILSAGTIANAAYVVTIFAATLFLQEVRGLSSTGAALVFLALSIGAAASGQLSGRTGDIPPQWVAASALLVGGLGVLGLTLSTSWWVYLPSLTVVGLGLGLGWAYASVGGQVVVRPEQTGMASGLTLTVLVSMGGIAVAAASTAMQQIGHSSVVDHAGPIDDVLRVAAIVCLIAGVLTPVLGHLPKGEKLGSTA